MILKVTCPICGDLLVTVEKPVITQDDFGMYSQIVCDSDESANGVSLTVIQGE